MQVRKKKTTRITQPANWSDRVNLTTNRKKMKRSNYIKLITVLLCISSLHSCVSDEIPGGREYCNIHWTLNHDYIDNLLFDYKTTDTLLYKRTINNEVKDTIVFVKQKSYHDTLRFHNGDVDADPNCSSSKKEFTRERIGWDYSSQYDSIFFNVQVLASGEGRGNDNFLVYISEDFNLTYSLGSGIGNYGLSPFSSYSTSEYSYDYTWWTLLVNKISLTSYGTSDYNGRIQLDWKCFYNINHGFVEISKTDRTEVWELVP
jgi:hypothetical protein